MRALLIASATALLCSNAMAYGEAGRWSSGYAQGTTEYTAVVDEQNQLYIACDDIHKVSMIVTINGKEYLPETKRYNPDDPNAFAVVVDGERFDTPYLTESDAGESSFHDMWDKLRDAKTISIVTADAQQIALPIKDVASVLPATKSPEFGCLAWDE
jgi:hypothetical protein